MSIAKRLLEDGCNQMTIAMDIALAAGVLKKCEYHEHIIYAGSEDIEVAYRLANHQVSNGEYLDLFKNRRELTDAIKEVVNDNSGEICGACERVREG